MGLYRFLARAIRGFDRRAGTNPQGLPTTALNEFVPSASNARQLGFLERGHPSRFAEACSALKVTPASEPTPGYARRSYGAKVIDGDGKVLWLKVFGLTSNENERWKAQIEADALTGIAKPELITQITWKQDDEFWVARLTSFATGIVESGPWAQEGAQAVTDDWLASLRQSLEALASQPCTRQHVELELFERWLWRHFRRRLSPAPSDWVPSHNDLQWSNLAAPDLSILDWEWYGRSPRGYDPGMLIAYSCHDDVLVARMERAFGSCFESEIANYGRIFAAHTIRNSIESGWLHPAMRAPVDRLIGRWEAPLR